MSEFNTSRIARALRRLKNAKLDVFGSEGHGLRLNPTLSEGDVVAFERKHGVVLPQDYRQFLTEVGNGGDGPFNEVFALGQMDDNFGYKFWQEGDGFVGDLSEPFPFEEEWNDLPAMPDSDLAESNEAEYDRQMEAFERVYWNGAVINGAIPICHQGCALRVLLVVTGSQAGFLWDDRRSEYCGLRPLRLADGSAATFGSWYGEWLDGCLAALPKN